MKRWTLLIVVLLAMHWLVSCADETPEQQTVPATSQTLTTVAATAVSEPTPTPEPTPLSPQVILQTSLDLLKSSSLEMTKIYTEGSEDENLSDLFGQEFEVICKVDVEAVQSHCILRSLLDEQVPTEVVWQNESVWMRQGGPWWQPDRDTAWQAAVLPGLLQLNSLGQVEESLLEYIQSAEISDQTLDGEPVYEITAVLDAERYFIQVSSGDEELGQGLIERMTQEDSIEATAKFIIDAASGQLYQIEEAQIFIINEVPFVSTIQYTFSEMTGPIDITDPPEQQE